MNGEQNQNNKPEKKNKAAIAGFILGLLLLFAYIIGFCGLILFFTQDNLVLFFMSSFLLTVPTLFFSVFGLRQNKQRIYAWFGLTIGIFFALYLPYNYFKFLPPGSLPLGLESFKFKKACPASSFWLNYDKTNIVSVQCQNTYFHLFGDIHFKSKSKSYENDDVIKFAENHSWKYHFSVPFTVEDFEIIRNKTYIVNRDNREWHDLDKEKIKFAFEELSRFCPSPFPIERDCNIHVFSTGSDEGIPSFAIVTSDEAEINIRYASPNFLLEDGLHDQNSIHWVSSLKELTDERKEE